MCMRCCIFTLFTLFGLLAFGTEPNAKNIANDRLLLTFNRNISAEEKNKIIESCGAITSYTHLPSPSVTICFTNNYATANEYFKNCNEVISVSFFITDGNHYAGVLSDFFVKLTDKNFEPFFFEKLRSEGIADYQADKYIPGLYRIFPAGNKKITTYEWCNKFKQEAWCSYAVPNFLFNPLVNSNDPLYTRQWNIENKGTTLQGSGTPDADMDVDSAWTLSTGNLSIKVAIIDSGVDTLHEDLSANMLPGHDAVSDSTDGYPTPAYKEDGHGTCCAGIVAAIKDNNKGIAGVAPSCKIIPVRAFYYILLSGSSGPLPFSTAAAFTDAIGWSWSVAGADILSNSWGLPPSLVGLLQGGTQPVEDAIEQAHVNGRSGKGVAMFFSSGNDNGSTGPIWPASMPQTIAVNATNMCDTRKSPGDCSGENWGGDHGAGLDFSAPGVKISTTDMTGNKGYTITNYTYTFNGTSAACPNAAAVGALLLSLRPELTAEDVRNVMAQSVEKVGGYNYSVQYPNGTWCPELGYGRVNAYNALQHAFNYSSVTSAIAEKNIRIYPNPSNGLLYLYSDFAQVEWSMFNMAGAEVMRGSLERGVNLADVSLLLPGVYVLTAKTENGTITRKITLCR